MALQTKKADSKLERTITVKMKIFLTFIVLGIIIELCQGIVIILYTVLCVFLF
jgi:hypothetical protein